MPDTPPAAIFQLSDFVPVRSPHFAAAPASATAVLTARLKSGDAAAFREFHARYFDALYRFLLVVHRGDEHLARDAVQETLLRVVRYVRVFDDEEALLDWLKVVARNVARDSGRKRQRYRALLERFTFDRASELAERPHEPWREMLEECLGALPPEDRDLVQAKYIRGNSVAELAAQTGLTEKAIESRLLRLRRELARRLLAALKRI